MNYRRYLGILLFVIGMLAAMVAAAKKPKAEETWPDTTPWAIIFLLPSTLGALLWRKEDGAIPIGRSGIGDQESGFSKKWREFFNSVNSMSGGKKDLTAEKLVIDIKKVFETQVPPLLKAKGGLLQEHGSDSGLKLWLELARGERLLRRAQSAALDGYENEAIDSYLSAMAVFSAMNHIIDKK
jgi:hypothetical protein